MGETKKMSEGNPWNPENKRIIDSLEELGEAVSGKHVDPHQQEDARRQQEIDKQIQAEIASQPNYVQQPLEEDRARVLQFMHQVDPLQENEGTLKGEVPLNMLLHLFGYLSHNSSFSDLDEDELKSSQIGLERAALYVRMATPRKNYTPQFALEMRNALHLAKLKLNQNKDGSGGILAVAQLSGDFKSVDVGPSNTGRIKSMVRNIRQRKKE